MSVPLIILCVLYGLSGVIFLIKQFKQDFLGHIKHSQSKQVEIIRVFIFLPFYFLSIAIIIWCIFMDIDI